MVQAGKEGEAGAVDGAAEALLSPRGARKIGAVQEVPHRVRQGPTQRSRVPRRARVTDGVRSGETAPKPYLCTQLGKEPLFSH